MLSSDRSGGLAASSSSVALRRAVPFVPLVATVGLAVALSFTAGGFMMLSTAPWAIAWVALGGGGGGGARPPARPPAALLVALGALGVLALWTGLSIVWSIGPDLSWVAFNYVGLYVAAAVALAWGGTCRPYLWVACGGYLACATAVAVYAYLGKVLPDVLTHAHEFARLAAPVGYWNGLAVMLVMGTPIALALAARRGLHPLLRAAAAAVLALLFVTLFFTFSRGGFAAALLCLVVYFAAARERLSSLLSLISALVPTALVLWHLRGLDTLFGPTQNDALRTTQGHTLGVWTIAILAGPCVWQLGSALGHRRLHIRPAVVRWVGVSVLALILLVGIGGPLVYIQSQGGVAHWVKDKYHDFVGGASTGADTEYTAGRLTVVTSNGRLTLYKISLEQAECTPWVGTGAGTYAFSMFHFRDTGMISRNAHSQILNELSEVGIVGAVLFGVFEIAVAVALVCALVRRRRDTERGLLAAAVAASAAFLFHIQGDWDWDMAAITLSFLILAVTAICYRGRPVELEAAVATSRDAGAEASGTVASDAAEAAAVTVGPEGSAADPADDGEAETAEAAEGAVVDAAGQEVAGRAVCLLSQSRRLAWPTTVLWTGLLAVLLASWLLPFLAQRAENDALVAMSQGSEAVALASARRAHSLNPLSADALITLSAVEEGRGRPRAAVAALREAARLQPDNYYVHYKLGLLLYTALGRTAAAQRQFERALQLNPLDHLSQAQLDMLGGR